MTDVLNDVRTNETETSVDVAALRYQTVHGVVYCFEHPLATGKSERGTSPETDASGRCENLS